MSHPGVEIGAGHDHVVARRVCDHPRRDRIGNGLDPGLADLLERLGETDAIDFSVRRQARHQDGDIEAPALGIRRLGEQECLALRLGNAAAILPAHQWVHFCVFVDRLVDDDEQPRARKRENVLVQVGVVARMLGRAVAIALKRAQRTLACSIVHRPPPPTHGCRTRGEGNCVARDTPV